MTISKAIYKRGKTAGVFPSLSSRRDEAYMSFIEDARNLLLHAQQKPIGEYSRLLLQNAGKSMESDPRSTTEAKELLMKDNVLKTYYRVKRSLQESFWECTLNSLNMRKKDLLRALDDAEKIEKDVITSLKILDFSLFKSTIGDTYGEPLINIENDKIQSFFSTTVKIF